MYNAPRRRAFSLVELSIVLVILGLLVGGVLSGQSLIRASQLRAVTSEYTRYKTAVGTFRDKYFAIPGDMTTATSFWGTSANCPGTFAQGSTTTATCNGDGDGVLNQGAATSDEIFRFWQHLANAGLIEGSYSGVTGGAGSNQVSLIGSNVPPSHLTAAGWSVYNAGVPTVTSTLWFEGTYNNIFMFGLPQTGTSITDQPVLKAEEAWNIDTKLDDGKPGTGTVRVYEVYGVGSTNCHDQTASAVNPLAGAASYALSNSSLACNLIFLMQY